MILVDECGAFITDKTIRFARSRVGKDEAAYVIMHPLQLLSCVEALPMSDVLPGALKENEIPESTFTGVRLVQDAHFPSDLIEYRNKKHEVILRIKGLAVPEVKTL